MTTPEIQAFYVKPSYELPINPNVKLDDPRLLLFYKNKTQGFPTHWFYGNRPDWLPNFQGYLLGQKTPRPVHRGRTKGDHRLDAAADSPGESQHSVRISGRRGER